MNVRILIVECRSRRGRDGAVRAVAHALGMDVGLLRERLHARPSWLLDLTTREEATALADALGRLGLGTRIVPSIARADTASATAAVAALDRLTPPESLVPDLVPTGPEKTTRTARGERTPAPRMPGGGAAPPPLRVRAPTPPAAAPVERPEAGSDPRKTPAPATRAGRPVRGPDALPARDPRPTPSELPPAVPRASEPITTPREASPREPITLDAITTPLPDLDPSETEPRPDATSPSLPAVPPPGATAPALPPVSAPHLVSAPGAGIEATDPEFEAQTVTAPFPRPHPERRD